jgi:predicted lipid-binding transport protein (Tim44 family)
MGEFQFFDIILFAAIAAFFVLRLRNVLGKRTGHEKPPGTRQDSLSKQKKKSDENVISLPDRARPDVDQAAEEAQDEAPEEHAATPLDAGLMAIKRSDKTFDPEDFLTGATGAFELVITAFSEGNTDALRPLLANDVYDDFAGAIEERQSAGNGLETTLVGVKEASLVEAELQGRTAFVTVKFVSEQINVMTDADGEPVEGDQNQVATVTDLWTFARNMRSRDPNWTLVATQSPN